MGLDRVVLRLSTLVQASLDLGRHVSSSPVDCCQLHVAGSELSLSKLPVRILAVIAFFVRSLACTDGKWQCGVVWPLSWSRMKCPTRQCWLVQKNVTVLGRLNDAVLHSRGSLIKQSEVVRERTSVHPLDRALKRMNRLQHVHLGMSLGLLVKKARVCGFMCCTR